MRVSRVRVRVRVRVRIRVRLGIRVTVISPISALHFPTSPYLSPLSPLYLHKISCSGGKSSCSTPKGW